MQKYQPDRWQLGSGLPNGRRRPRRALARPSAPLIGAAVVTFGPPLRLTKGWEDGSVTSPTRVGVVGRS